MSDDLRQLLEIGGNAGLLGLLAWFLRRTVAATERLAEQIPAAIEAAVGKAVGSHRDEVMLILENHRINLARADAEVARWADLAGVRTPRRDVGLPREDS